MLELFFTHLTRAAAVAGAGKASGLGAKAHSSILCKIHIDDFRFLSPEVLF